MPELPFIKDSPIQMTSCNAMTRAREVSFSNEIITLVKDTALARQIAMYQIRRMTNLSLKEIGKEFEGRDHTTVMHSIDRIEKLTKTNPEIAEVIKDINANINARYE